MKLELPLPKLFYISLVRLATSLWMSKKLQRQIVVKTNSNSFNEKDLSDLIKETFKNIDTLRIPEDIKPDFQAMLRCVGQEIYDWIKDHIELLEYNNASWMVKFLVWTQHGTINRRKTAEILVKRKYPDSADDHTDIIPRFKLSCRYGLEHAKNLWRRLEPEKFHGKNLTIISEREDLITAFWCYYLEQNLEISSLANQESTSGNLLLRLVEKKGNLPTIKFLWGIMTNQEQLENISQMVTTCAQHGNPEVLLFLMAELTQDTRMQLYRNHTLNILITFSHWPYQNLGLTLYSNIQEFLPDEDFMKLPFKILSYLDYTYQDIVIEIFKQRLNASTLFLELGEDKIVEFFEVLLERKYIKALKFIMSTFDSKDKFSMLVEISHFVIRSEKDWMFLDAILPLALSGRFDVIKYKTFMKNYAKTPDMNFTVWNSTGRLTLFELLYDNFPE